MQHKIYEAHSIRTFKGKNMNHQFQLFYFITRANEDD